MVVRDYWGIWRRRRSRQRSRCFALLLSSPSVSVVVINKCKWIFDIAKRTSRKKVKMVLFRTVIVITTILMGCCSFALDTKFNNGIGKLFINLSLVLWVVKILWFFIAHIKRGERAFGARSVNNNDSYALWLIDNYPFNHLNYSLLLKCSLLIRYQFITFFKLSGSVLVTKKI